MAVGLKPLDKLMPIAGIRLSAVHAGLRYRKRPDLVALVADEGTQTTAVFTKNRFAAAPVIVAREHLASADTCALLVNAGQANAGTGNEGIALARQSCLWLAQEVGCAPEQVLPFSTGVIGVVPPAAPLQTAIPGLCSQLRADGWHDAAEGIVTTDTAPKGVSAQAVIAGTRVTITGITKGSGMIRPNMATMLAFIATDAAIAPDTLHSALMAAVNRSFNRITVDGDTSTNDACVLMATGRAGNPMIDSHDGEDYEGFVAVLTDVCVDLAKMIVRDGEGATKFVTIDVREGGSVDDCLAVAYTVAHSPLVKTALFASDPNWGRILAAVGRAPVGEIDIDRVEVDINDVAVVRAGSVAESYTEERGKQAMAPEDVVICIRLGGGSESATVWTTDLSYEYVRINADYRS
jgi:glutamate N-acetyltransferase/amino-acid N-acetyltransferase